MSRTLLAAGLIASSLLGACAGMQAKDDDLESLKEAVEGYNHAFRWKSYGQAAQFLPLEMRGPFLAAYEDEEASLQIEEYRMARFQVHDKNSATVTVRVRFLMLPSVIVQKKTLTQHWHRVADAWVLEGEDNSIRALDPTAMPKDLGEKPEPSPDQLGDTEVEVFGPGDEAPKAAEKDNEPAEAPPAAKP